MDYNGIFIYRKSNIFVAKIFNSKEILSAGTCTRKGMILKNHNTLH